MLNPNSSWLLRLPSEPDASRSTTGVVFEEANSIDWMKILQIAGVVVGGISLYLAVRRG